MIRPKVHWVPDTTNWGDAFTPFLFERMFGVAAEYAPMEKAEVFCCGSLLERVPESFTGHILGSGIGYKETRCNLSRVQAPLLLRGRMTAERCQYSQPARFGDPAILANQIADAGVPTTHRYGVVPHYADKYNVDVLNWVIGRGARRIDIESGIREVIRGIRSCEMIVSSSLHGLVIADSLGIPNRFVQLSDMVLSGTFKFCDYYSAYGETVEPAFTIETGFRECRTRDVEAVRKDVQDVFTEYFAGLPQ